MLLIMCFKIKSCTPSLKQYLACNGLIQLEKRKSICFLKGLTLLPHTSIIMVKWIFLFLVTCCDPLLEEFCWTKLSLGRRLCLQCLSVRNTKS